MLPSVPTAAVRGPSWATTIENTIVRTLGAFVFVIFRIKLNVTEVLDPAAHGMGAPKGSNGDRLGRLGGSNEHLHPNHTRNSGLRIKAYLALCDFRTGPISP